MYLIKSNDIFHAFQTVSHFVQRKNLELILLECTKFAESHLEEKMENMAGA